MLTVPLSQTEQALHSILIHKTSGEWLRRLGKLYGMPFPGGSEAAWRNAMEAAAFGPRGTLGCTWDFLQKAFEPLSESIQVFLNPAAPQRLSEITPGDLEDRHRLRLVRVKGQIYYVVGPHPSVSSWVQLSDVTTTYWKGADFSLLDAPEAVTAEWLAPVITEDWDGKFQVNMTGEFSAVPPTYMQPDDSARPGGQPYGGHMIPNETVQGDQVIGPFPIYLPGPDAFPEHRAVLDALLAAGIITSIEII
jgi:hypothetical protein